MANRESALMRLDDSSAAPAPAVSAVMPSERAVERRAVMNAIDQWVNASLDTVPHQLPIIRQNDGAPPPAEQFDTMENEGGDSDADTIRYNFQEPLSAGASQESTGWDAASCSVEIEYSDDPMDVDTQD